MIELNESSGPSLLREWLKKSRISCEAFGRKVGVCGATIRAWQAGINVPKAKFMRAIEAHTNGAVPESSWAGLVGSRRSNRDERVRAVRAKSENIFRVPQHRLDSEARAYPEQPGIDYNRPKTRSDCERGIRPCPFVSCKYHLYLDVGKNGSIKYNFPDIEPADMTVSCALDVADEGGTTLEIAGMFMNITRERIRQVEGQALAKLHRHGAIVLREHTESRDAAPSKRVVLSVLRDRRHNDNRRERRRAAE